MRGSFVSGLMFGLAVLGFWLGEGGAYAWDMLVLGIGAAGALVAAGVAPVRASTRAALGVSSLALFFVAWFAGAQSFSRAYNECVEKGEEVRVVLREYYRERHEYPDTLGALQAAVPCGRLSRPPLLAYQRTAQGYTLTFADRLVEHTATESEAFLPQK